MNGVCVSPQSTLAFATHLCGGYTSIHHCVVSVLRCVRDAERAAPGHECPLFSPHLLLQCWQSFGLAILTLLVIVFVLDLARNGELQTRISRLGSLSIECVRYYSAQIVDALGYMHSKGVIHRWVPFFII